MGYETKFDKQTKTLFCLCDCKREVLVIEYDHDLEIADLAIYSNHLKTKLSLLDRFRYSLKLIISGSLYADQMVLTKKHIKDIKNFCSSVLD